MIAVTRSRSPGRECDKCDHVRELNLEALAQRHADTLLIRLPLRCRRCGLRAFRVVVSGAAPR
jgi:hypothetical protein